KRFLLSRRNGFYLAVVEEGQLQAGDAIERLTHSNSKIRVSDIVRLYAFDKTDWTTMQRAVEVEALPESWRVYFQERLEKHQQV
ncbi:MAG: 3-alpha domain-containing protein, partial [Deinococcota bacterium]